MATTHTVHHHESHGNHPMSVVAFCATLLGFAFAGLWLVALGSGHGTALAFGLVALALFVVAATAFRMVSTHATHGPLQPENTDVETGRYLHEYRD
ncbi:hypothetical protein HUN08_13360 [Gordonia sp. X0973]|uniref:hypothetical protein n=1 Tax=Gordonia sp. X0973 TaxID=2742602 RepID=UPI000F525627|nr:hypothetical protein [Gordonia sp. X0973]QKT08062.1 hypothetical protein HUN08_13360 [Gordonia sp. X0973]